MRPSLVIVVPLLLVGCAGPRPGVLVMAHGGDPAWNRDVEAAVEPLRAEYPTEIAFGMATPSTIQDAVRRLEARGVNRIAVVRMFISGESFLDATEYILGLRAQPRQELHGGHAMNAPSPAVGTDEAGHGRTTLTAADGGAGRPHGGTAPSAYDHHHMEAPRPIRAAAKFVLSRRGVAESSLIDQILVDRVRALSREPACESVLILGHGPGDDGENERWLAAMQQRAARLAEIGPFRSVTCETLREDWPDKRAEAEQRIRQFVVDGNRDGGRVIVVPFRVAGFGPYRDVLAGLEFLADGRGFCPHPNMTRWLRETVREVLAMH